MSEVSYTSAQDIMLDPHWMAQNTGYGSHRAIYIGPGTERVRSTLVRTPAGQRSPWHGAGGWPPIGEPFPSLADGRIFLGLEGEVVLRAVGKSFVLGPGDVLVMNAVVYDYVNADRTDALFWTIISDVPKPLAPDPGPVWMGDDLAVEHYVGHPYYHEEPTYELAPDAAERIRYVPWSEYRLQPIAWHGEWGSHWGSYPYIESGVNGRVLRIPAGQITAPITNDRDVLLFGTTPTPDLQIVIDGAPRRLGLRDSVVVPASRPFSFANGGLQEAFLFESTEPES